MVKCNLHQIVVKVKKVNLGFLVLVLISLMMVILIRTERD